MQSDLNLVVYSPSDAVVETSDSFDNSYEIVEFTASETGTYDAQVQARTYSGSEIIGFAKTVVALPGWDYRKNLIITGTTAVAQTNYPMKLTVYKGSGTDTPGCHEREQRRGNVHRFWRIKLFHGIRPELKNFCCF